MFFDNEGCGCVWGGISAVMLIGGLLFAISNNSSSSSGIEVAPAHKVNNTPTSNQNYYLPRGVQIYEPIEDDYSSSSFTPDDAYEEGYDYGKEQGRNDGRNGRSHGYGYDDSNDYYNHYETRYCEGYEEGYDDGYASGIDEYEEAEECDDDDW